MPSCTNCTSGPLSTFGSQYFYSNTPSNCGDDECGSNSLNAKCVYYAGPNLSCSGVNTNDSIELALQKIDEQICSVTGDYTAYNFACLDDEESITTEAAFVEAISAYVCTLNTTVDTFINTTFTEYQTTIDGRFDDLEVPGITCTAASVTSTDTLVQVLNKYCTKFGDIADDIDISEVDWDSCYSVPSPPTTIAGGFTTLLDQICQLKTSITDTTLPTFNNTGSCLPSPGSADTLVSTIGKIKTRLCQSPTLDTSNLSSSCVTIPGTTTDLEGTLNNILEVIDTLSQNQVIFDTGDFSVNQVDSEDACSGKIVALQTPLNQDRLVAANALDASPGTLISKLVGVGVIIDDTTNTGKITITSTATAGDHKVLASSSDDTPGYLDEKLEGGDDIGISIDLAYDAGDKKVSITPSVDLSTLIPAILNFIADDDDLKTQFCELVASCPSPCDPPTDVQAIAESTSTTTTTTTTVP